MGSKAHGDQCQWQPVAAVRRALMLLGQRAGRRVVAWVAAVAAPVRVGAAGSIVASLATRAAGDGVGARPDIMSAMTAATTGHDVLACRSLRARNQARFGVPTRGFSSLGSKQPNFETWQTSDLLPMVGSRNSWHGSAMVALFFHLPVLPPAPSCDRAASF